MHITTVAYEGSGLSLVARSASTLGWLVRLLALIAVLTKLMEYVWSTPTRATGNGTNKLFVFIVGLVACLHSVDDVARLLFYLQSESPFAYHSTLAARLRFDGMALLRLAVVAALIQVFMAVRAARLCKSRRSRIAYVTITACGFMVNFFGAALYAWWTFAGYQVGAGEQPQPYSFNLMIGCWIWGMALVEITTGALLRVDLKSRTMVASSLLETALYIFTANLLRLLLNEELSTTSIWSTGGAIFCQPLACYYALALLGSVTQDESLDDDDDDDGDARAPPYYGSKEHVAGRIVYPGDQDARVYAAGADGTLFRWERESPPRYEQIEAV